MASSPETSDAPPPDSPPWIGGVLWAAGALGPCALAVAWCVRTEPTVASAPELALVFGCLLTQTFAFHGGIAAGLVALWALRWRRRPQAALLALVSLLTVVPPLVANLGRAAPPERADLVVLSANLLFGRADPEVLVPWIEEHQPDLIFLQEYTPRWATLAREHLSADYPHVWEQPLSGAWGQAIFSRTPLSEQGHPRQGAWEEPQLRAVHLASGRRLELGCVHAMPPKGLGGVREQRWHVSWMAAEAAARLKAADAPAAYLLAGDFNAPYRTNHLRELREAGLREAHDEAGLGRGATWNPQEPPFAWAPGIRLDHVLYAGALRCVDAQVGPEMASDHRPIVARFVWDPPQPP